MSEQQHQLLDELSMNITDIVDVVWLAAHIDDYPLFQEQKVTEEEKQASDSAQASSIGSDSKSYNDDKSDDEPQTDVHTTQPENDKAKSNIGEQSNQLRGMPFDAPTAPALPDKLNIIRSIRPLKHTIPSTRNFELDEERTVEIIATTEAFTLVYDPIRERWLDLVIVIDESPSMVMWHQTIIELIAMLQDSGIFRDISSYGIAYEEDEDGVLEPQLHKTIGAGRKPGRYCEARELIDAEERRLILLATDCMSDFWYNGKIYHFLEEWSSLNFGLLTILQLLPQFMWEKSALTQALEVKLKALGGQIGGFTELIEPPWYWGEDLPKEIYPIPIISTEPETIVNWANYLIGRGRQPISACYFFNPNGQKVEKETPQPTEMFRSAGAFLETKWGHLSNASRELLACLAAVPLTLPVIRIVHRAMVIDARQTHLAEIFYSGLLKRVSTYSSIVSSDQITYDFEFENEMRMVLLGANPKSRTEQVLHTMSMYVDQYLGSISDFRAIIFDPTNNSGDVIFDEYSRPFARIAILALRTLGGRYHRIADKISQLLTLHEYSLLDDSVVSKETSSKPSHRNTFTQGLLRSIQYSRKLLTAAGSDLKKIDPMARNIYQSIKLGLQFEETWRSAADVALAYFAYVEARRATAEWKPILQSATSLCEAGDEILHAHLLNRLAQIARYEQQFSESLQILREALSLSELVGDLNLQANIHINLAYVYQYQSDYENAEYYAQSALEMFETDNQHKGSALNILGLISQSREDYDSAMSYFLQAITHFKETEHLLDVGRTTMNLASLYYHLKNHEKAIKNYKECIDLFSIIGDFVGLTNGYLSLGAVYTSQEQYPLAAEAFSQIDINRLIAESDLNLLAMVYNNLGYVRTKLGEFAEAEVLLNRSLSIRQQIGNNIQIANVFDSLATLYVQTSRENMAIKSYQNAVRILEETSQQEGYRQTLLERYRKRKENLILSLENKDDS